MEKTTIEKLRIEIPGEPSRVTHQSGTRYSYQRGRAYKTSELKAWERHLTSELAGQVPDQPIEGAVKLQACFAFKCRRKKDDGRWKVTKPDTDNLVKTVKDVMTSCGFWKDDAQVVMETVVKRWSLEPGITLEIEQLE